MVTMGPNLAKAIIAVMKDVKNIEKNKTVGTGNSAYQGVSDIDVKHKIGEAMQKHGLCMLPISVRPKTTIERWEETSQHGTKQKQSVFTEVETSYILLHESGESIALAGYGHGTDPQDKAAGKATTYALKYTLLYTFLVPTGKIDDSDNEHSNEKEVAPVDKRPAATESAIAKALNRIAAGEPDVVINMQKAFKLTNEQLQTLKNAG